MTSHSSYDLKKSTPNSSNTEKSTHAPRNTTVVWSSGRVTWQHASGLKEAIILLLEQTGILPFDVFPNQIYKNNNCRKNTAWSKILSHSLLK